jgi:hypothetical protein
MNVTTAKIQSASLWPEYALSACWGKNACSMVFLKAVVYHNRYTYEEQSWQLSAGNG